jgi:serine/threonine-protein kinase
VGGGGISVPSREFERKTGLADSNYPVASRAVVTIKPQQGQDFSLLGIEPSGLVTQIIPNRQEFESLPQVKQVAQGEYQLTLDMDHVGWTGLILLAGDGPFDPELVQTKPEARNADWRTRFLATASERDWKSEMLWFRSVDKNLND